MNDDVLTRYIIEEYETDPKEAELAVKKWRRDNGMTQVADIASIAETVYTHYWPNEDDLKQAGLKND